MKCKRTDLFTPNIRQETVPELDEQTYFALLWDEEAEVSGVTGEYLIKYNYATEVKEADNGVHDLQ